MSTCALIASAIIAALMAAAWGVGYLAACALEIHDDITGHAENNHV